MVKPVILTDNNFLLYAAQNYTNTQCSCMDEFYGDLFLTVLIRKLLAKYKNSGVLKERLIINHIISFFNVFNQKAAVSILFFKIPPTLHPELKTVLTYLDRCPSVIENIHQTPYFVKNIDINDDMLQILNSI